ncbi:hypothetical protein AGABI1DRAFT_131351 [Agaricus bisporus var. burnettii JB137-S8]|uniref:Uncharacterized protein n=1 Tax=Agaricus bisporus var. burnettii (strain JB137-S8 / ATCC MYA-4627 / FGSC 10392) TaxID=597362 RepID=K5XPA8_AGABU|nr:uncharacterized protein AGABI1DRAFT_131351 [Agaricus bisporus var. burnettii JB137-S8]EKM76530.1 hypothetical protein AGABI1DRAFT_131351 [Agaricus bisporus var. burnettii JB137-S8]
MSIAECPRCGYHLMTDLRKGVSALEAEVRHLEDLIPGLQEEKAILLRRINNVQEKTRHLPFEVLSNIFHFARPPIDFTTFKPPFYNIKRPLYKLVPSRRYDHPETDFHYTLTAVSHRWRRVALSTPHLWTSVSLRILNVFTKFNTSILDFHFRNADKHPISIQLAFNNPAMVWEKLPSKRSEFLMNLEPLKSMIFDKNADKVQSLILIEPPVEWSSSINRSLSHCDSVTMHWPSCNRDSIPCLDFIDLASLQHISLIDMKSVSFSLPTTVSTLRICRVDLILNEFLLSTLVWIVELEFYYPKTGSISPQGFRDNAVIEPMTFHRLEKLTWIEMHVDENYDFLSHVRFASLTTLEWGERAYSNPTSEEGNALRLAFFSLLPSTLSSLTFDNLWHHPPNIVDLLRTVPQVNQLHLTRCSEEVVVAAVGTICQCPANTGESASDPVECLPNLCGLSLTDTMATLDPEIFVDMLVALHDVGPLPKRFHLTTGSDVSWDTDTLHAVDYLYSIGLETTLAFVF